MSNHMPKNIQKSRGYTLLFAVITAALALGVAAFILGVAQKQYLLSSTARNSTYSIYAADSGIECGAYAKHNGSLSTSSPAELDCAGASTDQNWTAITDDSIGVPVPLVASPASPVYAALNMKIYFVDGSCAIVSVYDGNEQDGATHHLIIDSRGYNIGNAASCPGTNPQTVERALELRYN